MFNNGINLTVCGFIRGGGDSPLWKDRLKFVCFGA